MSLSAYEQNEWDRLQKRKEAPAKKSRNLLPAAARQRISATAEKARDLPGAAHVTAAYSGAAKGLGKAVGGTAAHTVSKKSVVKQFKRAGHDVSELSDIHSLDLRVVDSVAKLNRVRYGHSVTAALGGFGSGAVVTGGEILAAGGTVAGAGAGAAPGLGTVATAVAADGAAVLGLSARTVAVTALYYGYDPHRPEEEVFMLSVIGLGMATEASAKTAAYAELSQLTQLLARNAGWDKLNEKVLTKIVQQFAAKFGHSLTRRKLGQFVPVAGVLLGAGLNFATLDRIAVAANEAYRERFLIERSGGELSGGSYAPTIVDPDEAISVIELLEEEGVLSADGPSADGSPETRPVPQ